MIWERHDYVFRYNSLRAIYIAVFDLPEIIMWQGGCSG